MISTTDLLWGLVFAVGTTGSCLAAAWLLVRGRWSGAPLALAFGVVGSALVVGVHLLPGMLGVLTRGTALATALAALAVATRVPAPAAPPAPARRSNATDPPGSRWIAAFALLTVAACVLASLRETTGTVVTGLDATSFHIPLVARFIQTGSVWGLHQWLPDYSNATYPANGNLLQLAAVLPFRHAFLAPLVAVPFMALAALAAYAAGRELGAGAAASALAAALFAAVPEVTDVSLGSAVTDIPTVAFLGAAIVFGLRGDLLVAGLALGLAAGTKWYGLSCAALLVVVWLVATRRWRALAAPVALGAAAGGFWLVRNWVETSNPLFPVDSPLFDAPRDVVREQAGFTILHYLGDLGAWDRYLLPAFERGFGWTGAALVAAALAAAVLARRGAIVAVTVAGGLLTLAYFATPYSAFGPEGEPLLASASTRYGLPALMALAGPAAWLICRGGRAAQLLAVAAVLDGLRRGFTALSVGDVIVGGLVAAIVAAATAALMRWARSPRRAGALPAAAAAAALLLGGTAVLRERANDSSYTDYSSLYAGLAGAVGLAGEWPLSDVSPVLPAFGERLRTDVRYVGRFEDGFLRRHRDREAFLADLADRDLLYVGVRGPELTWAERAGWRVLGRQRGVALLVRVP